MTRLISQRTLEIFLGRASFVMDGSGVTLYSFYSLTLLDGVELTDGLYKKFYQLNKIGSVAASGTNRNG